MTRWFVLKAAERSDDRETRSRPAAATAAEIGIVSTQAQTMRPATPHFTAESRLVAPTPTMAPVMVWVVETGMPPSVAPTRVMAPAVSAQKPPMGCSLVILRAHGLDDPPAAEHGAEGDGRVADQDHPERHLELLQVARTPPAGR